MDELEWLWMAWMAILRQIFTITNCHWVIICYLFAVESVYILFYTLTYVYISMSLHMWPAEKCGKRSSRRLSAEYLESTKKLQIFRGCYIIGILRNKTNIFIIILLSALSPFHRLQNTWLWITLNRHIVLNYVLRCYIWCSEAWLSKFLYS